MYIKQQSKNGSSSWSRVWSDRDPPTEPQTSANVQVRTERKDRTRLCGAFGGRVRLSHGGLGKAPHLGVTEAVTEPNRAGDTFQSRAGSWAG